MLLKVPCLQSCVKGMPFQCLAFYLFSLSPLLFYISAWISVSGYYYVRLPGGHDSRHSNEHRSESSHIGPPSPVGASSGLQKEKAGTQPATSVLKQELLHPALVPAQPSEGAGP